MTQLELRKQAIAISYDILDARTQGKLIVYISGKVTGLDPEETFMKFLKAQNKLQEEGYYCFNPTAHIKANCDWNMAMRLCLAILPLCDYIYLLEDWKHSNGARIEKQVADMFELRTWEQVKLQH